MFTGQMERDVSVGMDSETLLWDLPGPILVRYLKKIKRHVGNFILLYMQASFREGTDYIACR
jgi:hypothetical protein